MAGMTAEQKKNRLNQLAVWYENIIGAKHRGGVPKGLREEFLADNGAWDYERAKMWIRNNDPNWMHTKDATDRMAKLAKLYRNTYGPLVKLNTDKFKKQAEAFARGNPRASEEETLIRIFRTKILNSKEFSNAVPGGKKTFLAWLKKQPTNTDILTATSTFQESVRAFKDAWDLAETGQPIPASLLIDALKNDWDPEGPQFTKAIVNTAEYAGTMSYQNRIDDFNDKWQGMFGDVEPPAGLAEKYAKSPVNWDSFLETDVEKTAEFKATFPDYTDWKNREIQQGNSEDEIDITAYFSDRQEFIEAWQKAYKNDTAVNPELLAQAMRENWSITQWENKIKTMPEYQGTEDGKERGQQFDMYWRSMFGSTAEVNAELRAKYMASGYMDPSAMWDDIKKTQNFRDTYQNWDAFENAQQNVGNNVIADPAAYNQYKAAMKQAFTDIGIEMPENLEQAIFASGVEGNDLQTRAQEWNTSKEAYQLQIGEKANVADAMGVTAGAAQSANIRDRLTKALEKQKEYSKSKFATAKVTQKNDMVTQRI